jgi:hypothetical protein
MAVNTEGKSRYNTKISRSAVPVRVLDLDEVNGRDNPVCIALGGFSAETLSFYGLASSGAVEKIRPAFKKVRVSATSKTPCTTHRVPLRVYFGNQFGLVQLSGTEVI